MGWDWLAVLRQKRLFLLCSGWEQHQHELRDNRGGFVIFPPFHLGSGFRVSDMRKDGRKICVPRRLSVSPPCSQLVPSIASSLVVGHLWGCWLRLLQTPHQHSGTVWP